MICLDTFVNLPAVEYLPLLLCSSKFSAISTEANCVKPHLGIVQRVHIPLQAHSQTVP